MCLLALLFRVTDDAPILVGANREEFYSRIAEPPQIIDGGVRAVAGVDAVAGGTWLGVNERGMLVAVTNRKRSHVPNIPRSRGLLAREMLALPTTREALDYARRELESDRYAGCNIICGDKDRVEIFHYGDWLRIKPLPPGVHVVTNSDVNDGADERVSFVANRLVDANHDRAKDWLTTLRELCRYTGGDGPAICFHGEYRGTVSSTLIALPAHVSETRYWHAFGPPDRTPYEDYSHLFRQISTH